MLRENPLPTYSAPTVLVVRTRRSYKPGRAQTLAWDYRPGLAQKRAEEMAARPKAVKRATNQELLDEVQSNLLQRLSPEQVAACLRREFPDDAAMRVSHETIYQSLYVQGRGALRRDLAVYLRTGRALRKPRRRASERRGRIPGMVSISERPAEVEDRAVPGHWEGDLILGKNGRSAIGTLVERSSRFVVLLHLPKDHGPAAVEEAMIAATQRLPQTLWKTLTWDRGVEMRNHTRISVASDLDIYFRGRRSTDCVLSVTSRACRSTDCALSVTKGSFRPVRRWSEPT